MNTSSSIYGFCLNLSFFLYQINSYYIQVLYNIHLLRQRKSTSKFWKVLWYSIWSFELSFGQVTRILIHRIFIDSAVSTHSNSSSTPVKDKNDHYLLTKENRKVTSAVNFILSKFVQFTQKIFGYFCALRYIHIKRAHKVIVLLDLFGKCIEKGETPEFKTYVQEHIDKIATTSRWTLMLCCFYIAQLVTHFTWSVTFVKQISNCSILCDLTGVLYDNSLGENSNSDKLTAANNWWEEFQLRCVRFPRLISGIDFKILFCTSAAMEFPEFCKMKTKSIKLTQNIESLNLSEFIFGYLLW